MSAHTITPDYNTYPGDRHTRQTTTQMDRKVQAAVTHTRTGLRDLDAILDDYQANAYRLNETEWAHYAAVTRAASLLADARRAILDIP